MQNLEISAAPSSRIVQLDFLPGLKLDLSVFDIPNFPVPKSQEVCVDSYGAHVVLTFETCEETLTAYELLMGNLIWKV